ncbi:four-helix bundle copper-binding protein [Fischerella sp. JS2]|uniref:four-helix bundle copper-binding protein n=1 Tax=Fischerella sp. JS2 TaxID=2597771 RepID=UPI0028E1C37D|nr:four-helix bundle copper-binding protein [Fischerella sp. JS2]
MTVQQLTLNQVNQGMQQCIQNCLNCHSICLNTVTYCLQKGGNHVEQSHIRLLLDCVEICQTSANFMLRISLLHPWICGVCAQVCDRCAQDCERVGDDAQMKACADMCRRCAQSCRQMSNVAIETHAEARLKTDLNQDLLM